MTFFQSVSDVTSHRMNRARPWPALISAATASPSLDHVGDHDSGTLAREQACLALSHAVRATADDGDLVFQAHWFLPF
jgi:hypothetical protein